MNIITTQYPSLTLARSKCLEKHLGTEQVHDAVPRIFIKHIAICGSEDS